MKLLPSATTSAIIRPKTSVISVDKLVPNFSSKKAEEQEKTIVIKEKLTTIAGLLEGTLASKKKEETDKKKKEQQERRGTREAKLEKKPKTKGKLELPNIPGMSFLDRIKQFLMNILGGYLLYRLIEFAPLLTPILSGIMHVGEWLIDFGGKILNGLVTFIDWGYKAYDWTRGQVKDIFGEEGAKKFDDFAGLINKLLNGVLIGAMIGIKIAQGARKAALKNSARRGFDNIKGVKGQAGRFKKGITSDAARRYTDRYGKPAAIRRFGPDAVKSLGGKYARSRLTNLGRAALVKGLGKGGVKTAAKILKPLVKNVPLIGGIMEFVLSWISGDPIGKAAFRGIGAGLGTWVGGAIGTLFGPGIGTFIGSALGGSAGGELGGLLYDTIFKDKEPPSQPADDTTSFAYETTTDENGVETTTGKESYQSVGGEKYLPESPTEKQKQAQQLQQQIQGRQEGGQVKPLDTTTKKVVTPNYEKGIQQVSKVKLDDNKSKFADSTKAFNQIDYFGPILATATKILAGDDPSQSDYKSIGAGFNNLLLKGFRDKKLKSNLAIGYNDGGIVSADTFKDAPMASSNFSNWIGDTFKGLFAKNKPSIEKSTKETKDTKTTKETPKTLEGILKQAIESMSGVSMMRPGSTDGPGSVGTVRDTATGADISTESLQVPQVADGEWGSVLDLIYKYEAGPGGYESMYPGTTLPGATKMTIAEVASKATGAVGAWQNLPEYLNERARAVGLDPSTALYDKENQEKIAVYLIGRGQANVTKDLAMKNPKEAMLRLSKVWAAIPKDDSGVSYYAGVGNNAAHIKPQQMYNAFQRLQFGGEVNGQQGVDKVPAMLTSGEFVMDKDSTMAIQTAFPGFLSAVNKAEGQKAVEVLMNYASYNDPTAGEVVVIDRKEVIAQAPMQNTTAAGPVPSGSSNNFKEILSFVG